MHRNVISTAGRNLEINELPRRKQRGIRCHAGHDPASSLNSWIPAFAGMTTRGKPRGIKPKEIKDFSSLRSSK
jgi:hypothetical protein